MRLILHAGTHKTGTSTIQQVLWDNRERLVAGGVYHPDPRAHFGGTFTAHHPLVHAVATQDGEGLNATRAALAKVRANVGAEDDPVLLLSAEPVYRHILAGAEGGWWRRHRAHLDALAGELATAGFDVEVALVFRRRDDFVESLYHGRVAHGFGRPFSRLIDHAERLLDYDRQLREFRRAFPRVRATQFDELAGPDLVGEFLRWLRLHVPLLETGPWERRSVDARLTLRMAAAYRDDPGEELVTERRRFAKSPVSDELFDDYGKVTLWTDATARRELLDAYSDHDPIRDDRPPAVLTDDLEDRIDDACDAYLEAKGLQPTNRRARRHA